MFQTAEGEVTAEVRDPLLREFLYFGHAGFRGAEDGTVLGQVVVACRCRGAPLPPVIEAVVYFTAGAKCLTPLDHVQRPGECLARIGESLPLSLLHKSSGKWNARHRHVIPGRRRQADEAVTQVEGVLCPVRRQ